MVAPLTSVTFAEGSQLTSIAGYAFSDCTGLTSIELPASVTSIGKNAFCRCTSLECVTFEEGSQLTSIAVYAFSGCTNLKNVSFANPEGWWYAYSASATEGTALASETLADASTAATYLKTTYQSYYWKRG